MPEEKEKSNKNSTEHNKPYIQSPYLMANLGFKAAAISFSVSFLTKPFQSVLTQMQFTSNTPSALSGGFFREMYRGFLPYVISGQQRCAVALTAKQNNKKTEETSSEVPLYQRCLATLYYSQAELLLSNALNSKSKLENAGIITKSNFNWSLANYWKLTTVNWGARSLGGFINFSAIGIMGDYISSRYKFNNNFYNVLFGGATSGVIATLLTTLPNSYSDRKLLASKMENRRLLTESPFTLFNQMKSHVKTVGLREATSTFMKNKYLNEVMIRSPQAALSFGLILGLDYLMGTEPLRKVRQIFDHEIDNSNNPTKRFR